MNWDISYTARRMMERHGAGAHAQASYNYMNNHGKNDEAAEFWKAVADEIKRLKREGQQP